jgi:hypothetical protein
MTPTLVLDPSAGDLIDAALLNKMQGLIDYLM